MESFDGVTDEGGAYALVSPSALALVLATR
jgi:hypothetical protein